MASSIDDLARRYGLCRETIYREIRAGRLVVRKVGRRSIVIPEDEAAWAQALPRLHLSGAQNRRVSRPLRSTSDASLNAGTSNLKEVQDA